MECPNCHQPLEAGAAFCGNCGQALVSNNTGSAASYTQALPTQHVTETKVLLALLCGIIGIVGALFIPLAGVALGIAGLIIATTTRLVTAKHWPLRAGLILSALALLSGLGSWTYAVKHDASLNNKSAAQNNAPASVSADLATPCYSVGFIDRLNISHASGSCSMSAYNGQSLDASSNAYKVYASQAQIINVSSFTNLAKAALEKDVKDNLAGFSVVSERVAGFAGSPAYTISASNKAQSVAVVETAVYHQVKAGDDIFILVHAVDGNSADLQILEAQWQWQ